MTAITQPSEVLLDPPVAAGRPLLVTLGSVSRPLGGLQTRARLTAEVLTSIGYRPSVVSTTEPDNASGGDPAAWCDGIVSPRRPPRSGFSLSLVRLIRSRIDACSPVIVTHATLMPAVLLARPKAPIIWDTNECHSLHYKRLPKTPKNRIKQAVWFRLEGWTARRCTTAVAIGSAEAREWRSSHPQLADKVVVVDHAARARARDPQQSRPELLELIGGSGPTALFVGTLLAKQNVTAVNWIRSTLLDQLPAPLVVVVCGPGSEGISQTGCQGARLVGLGAVDDVDSVIAGADVCIAPMPAGAGVKTKVLHYLSHGQRIVGTTIAFEGLAGAPGLFESDLDGFADEIIRVTESPDPPESAECRKAEQSAWLEQNHGTKRIAEQWKRTIECL